MPKNEHLDNLMVSRGLAQSRDQAQRLVMAGQVRVDGQVALIASTPVAAQATITVDLGPPFVSRGGEKLEAAFRVFDLRVAERVCADVGASTGGFTDCLLQHGAAKVFAIDVGQGILAWKLRQDPRVVVMEGINARSLDRLPEPVSLVTIDASFISLKSLLPVVRGWLDPDARSEVISLVKPQFEAGQLETSRGRGVIRDPEVHRQVLLEVLNFAQEDGFSIQGVIRSPLRGPKGNVEFLAWLVFPASDEVDWQAQITQAMSDGAENW